MFLALVLVFSLAPAGGPNQAQASETYEFITKWGSLGAANGQFDYPQGIAVDASGNVYVADAKNNRIQKFTSTGSFITKWGNSGDEDGQFSWPSAVAVHPSTGDVYVSDLNNNRIQQFTSTGAFIRKWGSLGPDPGEFKRPGGIAFDSAGNVYVADTDNDRIQRFTSTGGSPLEWKTYSGGPGAFERPQAIAIDSNGNIYVADLVGLSGGRIVKFNSARAYQADWTGFSRTEGLTVDSAGNVFAANTNGHQIRKYSPTGTQLAAWGAWGSANGSFRYPAGVAVDSSGNVYVADTLNDRVQKFNLSSVLPPLTTLTTNPSSPNGNNGWFKTDPTITLARNKAGTTYYRWGTSGSWISSTNASVSFKAGQGTKTLYYYSTGNSLTETTKNQAFKVDSVAPTGSVSAPAISTNVSKTTTFKVSWTASDAAPSSGIASYHIQRRIGPGGTWGDWRKDVTAKSAEFTGKPGQNYYFRIQAKDGAGNVSASWSPVKRVIVPFDNDSSITSRSGFGSTITGNLASDFYLGTSRYSTKAGHKITYKFTGNRVALVGPKSAKRSKAKIYINGKYMKTIDAYSSTLKHRQVLYSKTWAASATRTITIENLGTSGRTRFDVDGLAVGR
jgi:sugar lactone lactonase YvrE